MGYMRHHAFLVTTFDQGRAQAAHEKAMGIFGQLVSELNESIVNGYYSFAIFPDGSKEGWGTSDQGDEGRALFRNWLELQRYEDYSSPYDWVWVEVQYGDDNRETRIVADSDTLPEKKMLPEATIYDARQ